MHARRFESPIGPLTITATGDGIREIHFGETVKSERGPAPVEELLDRAQSQLQEYFAGARTEFDLPLDAEGTEFQREVWESLREVPFGSTSSYGEIARRVGRPQAVRAVGAANGANPLPIVVPCHRIVGTDRRLTGYAGGLAIKRALLEHEGLRIVGERIVDSQAEALA